MFSNVFLKAHIGVSNQGYLITHAYLSECSDEPIDKKEAVNKPEKLLGFLGDILCNSRIRM